MPPLVSLWMVGAVVSYYFVVNFSNSVHDKWLLDSAVSLAQEVQVRAGRVSADLPPAVLRMFEYDALDQIYYRVSDDEGRIVAGQRDLTSPVTVGKRPVFYDDVIDGIPVRAVALRVEGNGGNALVQVAETLIKRRTLTSEILAAMLLPQLLLIVSVGFLVWYGVGRGLKPLKSVGREILQRSHRDLAPLAEDRVPREVVPIVHALNDLFLRLDRALIGQDRFIADAAHQLRTPLAGLKTQAELAMREDNPAAMRAALDRVGAAIDRSIHMVNQLLALARADHSHEVPVPNAAIDLSELARRATEEWVGKAIDANLDLGFEEANEPVMASGNAELLVELLDNLIDNALRYTDAGSGITVRVRRLHDGRPFFEVEDNGPGIALSERHRVFERFYRPAGSPGDGSGLGLAIVREIAALHGAEVELGDNGSGRGTRIRIIFPAPPAA